jgi:hypothetical protein
MPAPCPRPNGRDPRPPSRCAPITASPFRSRPAPLIARSRRTGSARITAPRSSSKRRAGAAVPAIPPAAAAMPRAASPPLSITAIETSMSLRSRRPAARRRPPVPRRPPPGLRDPQPRPHTAKRLRPLQFGRRVRGDAYPRHPLLAPCRRHGGLRPHRRRATHMHVDAPRRRRAVVHDRNWPALPRGRRLVLVQPGPARLHRAGQSSRCAPSIEVPAT